MAILSKGFHLFGTAKLTLRSLVVHRLQLAKGIDPKTALTIRRAYKLKDGGLRFEDANIDYQLFIPASTLTVHDLFLTENFGISVNFLEENGKFDFSGLDSDLPRPDSLSFSTLESEEVLPLCQAVTELLAKPVTSE
jgi:hypothetical protein